LKCGQRKIKQWTPISGDELNAICAKLQSEDADESGGVRKPGMWPGRRSISLECSAGRLGGESNTRGCGVWGCPHTKAVRIECRLSDPMAHSSPKKTTIIQHYIIDRILLNTF